MAEKIKLDRFDDDAVIEMIEDCVRSSSRVISRSRLQAGSTSQSAALLLSLLDVLSVQAVVLGKIMQKVTPQVLERIEGPVGAIDEDDPIHLIDPNS